MSLVDICGTPIDGALIKKYQIVKTEYIYRPIFREVEKTFKNMVSGKKYEYFTMEPYAAIVDEKEHGKFTDAVGTVLKDNLLINTVNEVAENVGDVLNIKTLKYKKYTCILPSGRKVQTYLLDVPTQLISKDGKKTEVYRNDANFHLLTETMGAAIELVPTLVIEADKEYKFYGNGIQLDNDRIDEIYMKLRSVVERNLEAVQAEKERVALEQKEKNNSMKLPKLEMPKVELPKMELPKSVKLPIGKDKIKISFEKGKKE